MIDVTASAPRARLDAWRAGMARLLVAWIAATALLVVGLLVGHHADLAHGAVVVVSLAVLAAATAVTAALLRRLAGAHAEAQRTLAEAEAATAKAAAAEKAELVGRLAGAVAHDVNNTLTVVVANAEFLAEESGAADQREAAAQIGEAARHAAALTQQMLVVSRKGLAQPRPLDVAAAVRASTTALRRLLPPAIQLAVEAPTPAWASIDPTQLHQLVLNLAMNARDAMPEGGALRVFVREVGGEVTITVADSGTGMDEATQAAAFQPFFTTKAPGKGTGLGLANVQAIVAGLGGRVGLASALGKGTTFELVLPACAPGQAAPPPPVSGARGHGRVLVVDGDVRIRALATTALLGGGYDVLDAPDGPTGLRLAARHRPELLVSDAVIPGLPLGMLVEGYWAARPGGRVLVTTAFSDDERVQAQVRSGELMLLPKPFSRAELLAAAAAALRA